MDATLQEMEARLRALEAGGKDSVEWVDLLLACCQAMNTNDVAGTQAYSEQAYDMAVRLGYQRGRAYALGYSGYAQYLFSNHDAARQFMQEALALFETLAEADPEGEAMSLGVLALVQISQGDFQQSLQSGMASLKRLRQVGNRLQEAWTLNGFGTGYMGFGDYERALQFHHEALSIFEELEEETGEGRALTGIGTVYQKLGEYEEAMLVHQRSLHLFRKTGNRLGEARALNDLGTAYQHLGAYEEALRHHQNSYEIREEVGNRQAQSTSLIHLGTLYTLQNEIEKALTVLHRALAIANDIQAKPRIYQAHQALADTYEKEGDWAAALHHYKAFQQTYEEVRGDETQTALSNLTTRFEVEKAEQAAEIERLRNVELKAKNEALIGAQQQLIQSEKMASLGQLTAGIAHEIKNPLNFVNNFAELSIELIEELREHLAANSTSPVAEALPLIEDLLDDLAANARRINEHGRRADGIVRSMLLHARGTASDRQAMDLNALLDEYVMLAYHGMRASLPDFNVAIERDYDDALVAVEVVPQDIGRVFINLRTYARVI